MHDEWVNLPDLAARHKRQLGTGPGAERCGSTHRVAKDQHVAQDGREGQRCAWGAAHRARVVAWWLAAWAGGPGDRGDLASSAVSRRVGGGAAALRGRGAGNAAKLNALFDLRNMRIVIHAHGSMPWLSRLLALLQLVQSK